MVDTQFVLGLVFRWLHILAAITAVGERSSRLVVMPALDPLPPDKRTRLQHAAMRVRWSKIVAAAIAFLLASGLYNVGVISIQYKLPRWYMPLFVAKFLLAMTIFAVASLLTGKTPAAERIRRHAKMWLNVNIALAVLVVAVSGILRTADKIPKQPVPPSGQTPQTNKRQESRRLRGKAPSNRQPGESLGDHFARQPRSINLEMSGPRTADVLGAIVPNRKSFYTPPIAYESSIHGHFDFTKGSRHTRRAAGRAHRQSANRKSRPTRKAIRI